MKHCCDTFVTKRMKYHGNEPRELWRVGVSTEHGEATCEECPGPQWDCSMCEVTPVTHGQDRAKGAGLGSSVCPEPSEPWTHWSLQTEAAEM